MTVWQIAWRQPDAYLKISGWLSQGLSKAGTKQEVPNICLGCTEIGVFLQLPAEKKTPFFVHLKQIFGPSFFFDRALIVMCIFRNIKVEMKVLSEIKSTRAFQQDRSSLKLHVFWIECTIYFNVLLNNFVNFCRKSYILGRRIQFEHSKFQRKCRTAELPWIALCPPFQGMKQDWNCSFLTRL